MLGGGNTGLVTGILTTSGDALPVATITTRNVPFHTLRKTTFSTAHFYEFMLRSIFSRTASNFL